MPLDLNFELLVMLNTAVLFTIVYIIVSEISAKLLVASVNIAIWFALALAYVASGPSYPIFSMVFFVIGSIFVYTLLKGTIDMMKEKRYRPGLE